MQQDLFQDPKPACSKPLLQDSAVLFDQIYNFIEGIRQTTMNKQAYDEALDILKKMINEKV